MTSAIPATLRTAFSSVPLGSSWVYWEQNCSPRLGLQTELVPPPVFRYGTVDGIKFTTRPPKFTTRPPTGIPLHCQACKSKKHV